MQREENGVMAISLAADSCRRRALQLCLPDVVTFIALLTYQNLSFLSDLVRFFILCRSVFRLRTSFVWTSSPIAARMDGHSEEFHQISR